MVWWWSLRTPSDLVSEQMMILMTFEECGLGTNDSDHDAF
jgi:hypothetical protein